MSDSLRLHGLQHTRLPCPPSNPGGCSNSCPSSQWCHSTIYSTVIPFSCLQSFPASVISMYWSWGRLPYLSFLFFGTLHSEGYIFPFFLCLLLLFFSQWFVRPPQTAILVWGTSFSWWWSWSLSPAKRHKPLSIVLQALCLSDLVPWIYLSFPLYNHKGFDLGHTEWSSVFPYFLQFKSELFNKEFMIWATVSSQSCFCW